MSTKTSFKRIALVAVTALGAGVLSVAPANAAIATGFNAYTNTPTVLTGTTGVYCPLSLEGTATGAATCTGQVNGRVQVSYKAAGAATYLLKVTNATVLAMSSVANGALTTEVTQEDYTNGLNFNDGITFTSAAAGDQAAILITAAAAGSSTFTVQTVSATTGALTTVETATITWSASSSLDPSAGNSRSIMDGDAANAAAYDATSDDTVIAPGTTATTLVALIKVTARDGNNNLLANGKTVTAVVSGPGIAGGAAADLDTYANGSRYESVTLAGGTGIAFFGIYADGTSGKSTISIMAGSTLLATETITFHGRPATVTVVQNHKIGSINGEQLGASAANPTGADIDNTPAVIVSVKDADGLPVSAQTVTAVSSDTAVMASAITCTESNGLGVGDAYAGEGSYNCLVTSVANPTGSGKTATMTFRVPNGITSGVFVSATPVTYTLGKDPESVKLSTDKTTYAPGEKVTLTVSALGSDGKAAADDIYTTLLSASGLAASTSLGGTLPGASVATVNGVKTYTLYAPLVSGTFTVSGTQGADTGAGLGKAVTTSFTVGANAELASITTLVNSLIAKLNALNKLVIKIQKKVKA